VSGLDDASVAGSVQQPVPYHLGVSLGDAPLLFEAFLLPGVPFSEVGQGLAGFGLRLGLEVRIGLVAPSPRWPLRCGRSARRRPGEPDRRLAS